VGAIARLHAVRCGTFAGHWWYAAMVECSDEFVHLTVRCASAKCTTMCMIVQSSFKFARAAKRTHVFLDRFCCGCGIGAYFRGSVTVSQC